MNAGDLLTLNIEKVAHGGLCVARHDGVVIFVRHALPGEIVEAKLISLAPGKRSWFAQTTSVKKASEKRCHLCHTYNFNCVIKINIYER